MALGKLLELLPFGKMTSLALDLAGQPVKDWLADLSARRAFDNAVKHACRAFDARHPELSDEFFDEVFIEHNVAPLLADSLNSRGQLPTPERIAEIWAATYHRTGSAARMMPYAADFMREIGRQVVAQKLLSQYVDEGHLDRAVVLLDEIRNVSISLADGSRREELEKPLDLLMYAAITYQLVAEFWLGHADPVAIATERRNAEVAYASARRRLERMEYIAASSLLADFEQLSGHHSSPYLTRWLAAPARRQIWPSFATE